MIVIADAGPLLHLFWVGAAAWALPPQPVLVVEAVWREVDRYAPEALDDPRLQRVSQPFPVPQTLTDRRLDSGEEAALACALTQPTGTDVLVLCDEIRGRRACRDLSLTVKGSVGLIIEAVQSGRTSPETARAALRELPARGRLYVSTGVIAQALAAIDEAEKT